MEKEGEQNPLRRSTGYFSDGGVQRRRTIDKGTDNIESPRIDGNEGDGITRKRKERVRRQTKYPSRERDSESSESSSNERSPNRKTYGLVGSKGRLKKIVNEEGVPLVEVKPENKLRRSSSVDLCPSRIGDISRLPRSSSNNKVELKQRKGEDSSDSSAVGSSGGIRRSNKGKKKSKGKGKHPFRRSVSLQEFQASTKEPTRVSSSYNIPMCDCLILIEVHRSASQSLQNAAARTERKQAERNLLRNIRLNNSQNTFEKYQESLEQFKPKQHKAMSNRNLTKSLEFDTAPPENTPTLHKSASAEYFSEGNIRQHKNEQSAQQQDQKAQEQDKLKQRRLKLTNLRRSLSFDKNLTERVFGKRSSKKMAGGTDSPLKKSAEMESTKEVVDKNRILNNLFSMRPRGITQSPRVFPSSAAIFFLTLTRTFLQIIVRVH